MASNISEINAQNRLTADAINLAAEDFGAIIQKKTDQIEDKTALLRESVNETQAWADNTIADLKKNISSTDTDLDDQINSYIDSQITPAADARIALITETDRAKRLKLRRTIAQSNASLGTMGDFTAALLSETSQFKNQAPNVYGTDGSYIVNGKDKEESLDYLNAINVLNKQSEYPDDAKVGLVWDKEQDGLVLNISGKRNNDGKAFSLRLNAKDYLKADSEFEGLISQVPSYAEANETAKNYAVNGNGKKNPPGAGGVGKNAPGQIRSNFLLEGAEDVVVRKGGYTLAAAKEVDVSALRNDVRTNVFQGAADGAMARNNRNYLKNTWEVNLAGFTDMSFAEFNSISNPREQRDILADALTEKFLFGEETGLLTKFETTGEGADKKYYQPGPMKKIVDKPPKKLTDAQLNRVIANKKVRTRAENLVNEVYDSIGKTGKDGYFNNKIINNKRVDLASFEGDRLILYTRTQDKKGEEVETPIAEFNLKNQQELKTLMNNLVVSQYGGDADAKDVKDAIKILLDEKNKNTIGSLDNLNEKS